MFGILAEFQSGKQLAYDLFPIEMKVKFWCNFCVYTKNWSFEKHRIGIIALLWQPILQKLNLKCCCHFCFLWLPTIWRDFFAEKKETKRNILMHFLQVFVLHFVLFGLFRANKNTVSRIHVITFIFVFGYLELSKSWFDINYAKNIVKSFSVQWLLTQLRHLMQAI